MIGVYKIFCKANQKSYIGSSIDILERKKQHFQELSNGTHKNKYLQNSWNKYGASSFTFSIEEDVATSDVVFLRKKESDYIKKYECFAPKGGFNIQDPCDIFRKSKKYYLISPSGSEIEGENITAFCRGYKLDRTSIGGVISGRYFQYKGWTNSFLNFEILKLYGHYKAYLANKDRVMIVTHPIHGEKRIFNISIFCEEFSVERRNVFNLLNGKLNSTKEWKLLKNEQC